MIARRFHPAASGGASAAGASAATSQVSVVGVFFALLERDLVVARRELASFLVRTALQPLLGVIVFGFILPHMGFASRNYTATLLPGILAITLTFASLQAVAFPMMASSPSRRWSRGCCRGRSPRWSCSRWRGSSWGRSRASRSPIRSR